MQKKEEKQIVSFRKFALRFDAAIDAMHANKMDLKKFQAHRDGFGQLAKYGGLLCQHARIRGAKDIPEFAN